MKKTIIIISAAFLLTIFNTSCNSDGNTGNGANDPTSQFEPNNIKEPEDVRLQQSNDSAGTTVDTTVKENRH